MIDWNSVPTIAIGVFIGSFSLELIHLGISVYLTARQQKKLAAAYAALPPEFFNNPQSMGLPFDFYKAPVSGTSPEPVKHGQYL